MKGKTNDKYAQGGSNGSEMQNIYNHVTHIELVGRALEKERYTTNIWETIETKTYNILDFFLFLTFISCL